MANTRQIQCPNCRQPVQVEVQQLFDLNSDPSAKQQLLSGVVNMINCPFCGYQGNLGTPIVYHDPEKELLLTFVPTELGLSREDQESTVGKLINRVVDSLPQEKRKGYLLNPEATLTYQRLLERILEEDGITKEMIEAQQERMNLIQRMMGMSDDMLAEVAEQEDELLDAEFFTLLNRLVEASLMGGDQESGTALRSLQEKLMPMTTFGRQVQGQAREIEAAMESIQALGEGLTREKLLDLILEAPSEARLSALVSIARPALDYTFFQSLTDRIERSQGEARARLVDLRVRLLELTQRVDQQMEARAGQARELLEELLKAEDILQATLQNLPAVDEFFVDVLNSELEKALRSGDDERMQKLQKVVEALQQASAPPPEVAFIQELLELEDQQKRQQLIQTRAEEITPEMLETLGALLNQAQSSGDEDLSENLQAINRLAVRQSMKSKLKEG
jgi:hypothetical protein